MSSESQYVSPNLPVYVFSDWFLSELRGVLYTFKLDRFACGAVRRAPRSSVPRPQWSNLQHTESSPAAFLHLCLEQKIDRNICRRQIVHEFAVSDVDSHVLWKFKNILILDAFLLTELRPHGVWKLYSQFWDRQTKDRAQHVGHFR